MTKADIVKKVSEKFEVSQTKAKEMYDAFEEVIVESLAVDGCVPFMGKFTVTRKEASMAKNPKTGEPVSVPAKNVIKHKADKATKEAIQ
jgi:nucleoid DNA-binding protein